MRSVLILVVLLLSYFANAQYKVTISVNKLPEYHNDSDPLFLAGSFNNWNRGNKLYQLEKKNGIYTILIDVPKGRHEYKLTRGNWQAAESGAAGYPLDNRVIEVMSDTAISVAINQWSDHFPPVSKKSTAGRHVKIIATDFYIPQLKRHRRIWIYLPDNYSSSRKKYPVLYMHDGQNVFEDSSSFAGEWGVDEALDTLGKKGREMIVVAIDNGGNKRISEYSPDDRYFDHGLTAKGEGPQYVDFLVNTLRPYIDQHYRTKRRSKHNYTAGSSMGGSISLYALLRYPKKWGGAGVFSPALWMAPAMNDLVIKNGKKVRGRIYFFAGLAESPVMVPDMLRVFESLHSRSKAKLVSAIRAEGKHNEATWRKEFPIFYQWLMAIKHHT